jgi:hypothetical protein
MKALLLAIGVLGLAAVFGKFEQASASAKAVTSDEVQLLFEQIPTQPSYAKEAGKNGKTRSCRCRA